MVNTYISHCREKKDSLDLGPLFPRTLVFSVNHVNTPSRFLKHGEKQTPFIWVLLSPMLATVKTLLLPDRVLFLFSIPPNSLLFSLSLHHFITYFFFFLLSLCFPYLSHKSPKGKKYTRHCLIFLQCSEEGQLMVYMRIFIQQFQSI